jgi:hypothetical protein
MERPYSCKVGRQFGSSLLHGLNQPGCSQETSVCIIHIVVYPMCNRYILKSPSLERLQSAYKHLLQYCAILEILINDSSDFALNDNRHKTRTLNFINRYAQIPDPPPRSQILNSVAINASTTKMPIKSLIPKNTGSTLPNITLYFVFYTKLMQTLT